MMMVATQKYKFAVLIPAHNEEKVIGSTVASIAEILSAEDALFVIADECTDGTSEVARCANATVFERKRNTTQGKGKALSWFLSNFPESILGFDYIIILDADSRLEKSYLTTVRESICARSGVLQSFVCPLPHNASPISLLAALSELLDQKVGDRLREMLKWPVRLRGTGMIFKPDILLSLKNRLHTQVEDLAMSLLLTAQGIKIEKMDRAIVYDPKPKSLKDASFQRARWFRGQHEACRCYKKEIARIIRKGPSGWALLCSLFLRPKWVLFLTALFAAILFSFISIWSALVFWFFVFLGFLYVAFGLVQIPERKKYIFALFHFPKYIWMWLRGVAISQRSSLWLRGRD